VGYVILSPSAQVSQNILISLQYATALDFRYIFANLGLKMFHDFDFESVEMNESQIGTKCFPKI
jgi:hypothetical protein